MLFKKKEADNDYALLKQQVMDEFEKLQNGNPFENPSVTRDKWNVEYENAKALYKLSKKYSNTIDDIEVIKNIKEQSKEKLQVFTHEAEALEYKNEITRIKSEFKDYNEQMCDGETLGDIANWYQTWKNIYENVENLYKNKRKFSNDGFDEEGLNTVYFGAKYYYAFYVYQLIYLETGYNTQNEILRKQACLKKCLDIIHECEDKLKFHILRGHVYYMKGQLWLEYAEAFGMKEDDAISRLSIERNNAYSWLKRIEEDNGINISSIVTNPIEWYIYRRAVYNLYSYFLYNKKNLERAHNLLEKEIAKHDITIAVGLEDPEFVDGLKEELSLFQKGFLGWKYIG